MLPCRDKKLLIKSPVVLSCLSNSRVPSWLSNGRPESVIPLRTAKHPPSTTALQEFVWFNLSLVTPHTMMLFGKNRSLRLFYCSLRERNAFNLLCTSEHLSSAFFAKNGARQIHCRHKYCFYKRVFILPYGLIEFRAADLKPCPEEPKYLIKADKTGQIKTRQNSSCFEPPLGSRSWQKKREIVKL